MTDPTPAEIASRYTRRAFSVLRVAGGLADSADADVRRLGRDLVRLIQGADIATLGRRDLAELLRDVEARIAAAYSALGASQLGAVREVLAIEAAWASTTLGGSAPAESLLARWWRDLVVLGAPPAEQWQRQGDTLARRLADAIRDAQASNATAETLRATLGEIIDAARRDAQALADVSTTSAAAQGRAEVARQNGSVGFRWHAVLDSRVTTGCAMRAGLLYTLDYQPMGHTIPIERPPPRHWGCRSILLPLRRMPRATDRPVPTFESWVAGLSDDDRADVLGRGRAELWQRGELTKADLVNQRGRVLTLAELRARAD